MQYSYYISIIAKQSEGLVAVLESNTIKDQIPTKTISAVILVIVGGVGVAVTVGGRAVGR